MAQHEVTYDRNTPEGRQTGTDAANSIQEAYALAAARVSWAGIPSRASVIVDGKEVRVYGKDFDGRVSYYDVPQDQPEDRWAGTLAAKFQPEGTVHPVMQAALASVMPKVAA